MSGELIINTELNDAVIGFFNQSQAARNAARALTSSAFGPALSGFVQTVLPTQNRSFQLVLTGPIPAPTVAAPSTATGVAQAVNPGSGSSRGAAPVLATVVFDVATGRNTAGFMQRISYVQRARQSVQHTLGGFHYNEYGIAPGRLEIDAAVVWSPSPSSDYNNFFQLIKLGKSANPLTGTAPCQLRFTDTYLGITLIISQEDCSLDQDAERPNQGRLRINAAVLYDYSSGVPPTSSDTISPGNIGASLVNSVIGALTNLI
jgi:hypothetical protein